MGILSFLGFDGAGEREPVELNDANFGAEVGRSELPVMVDVWSAGCGPCAALVPTVKRLAHKYDGRVKVGQLNVGSGMKTAARLGVRGTPTVLFFKSGSVVERVVGLRGQHYYEEIIEDDLLGGAARKEAAS
jgi:thioredoxin 1